MKKILISLAGVLCATMMYAQAPVDDTMNPLITAMPSLSIAPDARAAGLGDVAGRRYRCELHVFLDG